jgi:tRNA G10  N-methylase Trm11
MKPLTITFILYTLVSNLCSAQVKESKDISKHGDCISALEIDIRHFFGPTTAPSGHGNELEIDGNKLGNTLYFEKEHNTTWYKFTIPNDGLLSLDIIPLDFEDDYDFILYKLERDEYFFCNYGVKNQISKPIRTNLSRNKKQIRSMTGLEEKASQTHVSSGIGQSYSKSINVIKGETYYLVTDNVYDNGSGHSIKFSLNPILKKTQDNAIVKQEQLAKSPEVKEVNINPRNLVLNPSFEDYHIDTMHSKYRLHRYMKGGFRGIYVDHWKSIHAAKRPNGRVEHKRSNRLSNSGFHCVNICFDYPEGYLKLPPPLLEGELKQKLEAGKKYQLTYYVCRDKSSNTATKELNTYFGNTYKNIDSIFKLKPTVTYKSIKAINNREWKKVVLTFKAKGGEKHIYFGNLESEHKNIKDYNPSAGYNKRSMYFLDDIELIKIN